MALFTTTGNRNSMARGQNPGQPLPGPTPGQQRKNKNTQWHPRRTLENPSTNSGIDPRRAPLSPDVCLEIRMHTSPGGRGPPESSPGAITTLVNKFPRGVASFFSLTVSSKGPSRWNQQIICIGRARTETVNESKFMRPPAFVRHDSVDWHCLQFVLHLLCPRSEAV